ADSRTLATAGWDGSLALYDSTSGKLRKRLPRGVRPHTLALHPDGRHVAVASMTGKLVEVRDLETGKVTATLRHPAGLDWGAWGPGGRLLATGCDDHNGYVWDSTTGRLVTKLEGHTGAVIGCTFSHRGDLLATRSWDGTSRLWDHVTGRQIVRAPGEW